MATAGEGNKNILLIKTSDMTSDNNNNHSRQAAPTVFAQTYFHGTKANLQPGDLIEPGFQSNYGDRRQAAWIFLSATLDAAIWGAELAAGDGPGRIYVVEPTGVIEDDPDVTDKKFPGNPTQSYRSKQPFRVLGEVTGWQGHAEEQVQAMKDAVAQLIAKGIRSLNDEE